LPSCAPALVSVELDPAGGTLVLQGHTADGPFERAIPVPRAVPGNAAVAALYGREAVEDLETARAAGEDDARLDAEVERLGLTFQLSTRLTAWVAVSEEPTVDPTKPTRREEVPQMLPHGMSADGLGLRRASGLLVGAAAASMPSPSMVAGGPPPAALMKMRRASLEALRSQAPKPTLSRGGGAADKKELERGFASLQDEEVEGGPVRRLTAKVKRVKDRLVFEIEILDPLFDWSPPFLVRLSLRDGSQLSVKVDRAATTEAGKLGSGFVLRLVTEREALDPASIEEVTLLVDGTPLVLSVRN
jgi:Ca-activated chloride channel family protein